MQSYIRKSPRFEISTPLDVAQNGQRMAFGTLIDISRDGLGFIADPQITIGQTYLVTIKGIGGLACHVLHCSNHNRYGGDLRITDSRKARLDEEIQNLLEQGIRF